MEKVLSSNRGFSDRGIDFPSLDAMTYLNTGTVGITPAPVVEDLIRYSKLAETEGQRAYEPLKVKVESTRGVLAETLNASVDEIAFGSNATEAINWVAAGLDMREGDEVLMSNSEHPAMLFPWGNQRDKGKVRLRWFDVDHDPEITLSNLQSAITANTRIISVSHVERHHGVRLPVKEICELAKDEGVLSLVDGAQSLGMFPVDVQAMGCDFYVGNGHKWLCGPNGIGILYVNSKRLKLLTPAHAGPANKPGESFWDKAGGIILPNRASKYEYGTRNLASLAALASSVQYHQNIGIDLIEQRLSSLADTVRNCIRAREWLLTSPEDWTRGSVLVSFHIPEIDAKEFCRRLASEFDTFVSPNSSNGIRVSPHFYNTEHDINDAFSTIDSALNERES